MPLAVDHDVPVIVTPVPPSQALSDSESELELQLEVPSRVDTSSVTPAVFKLTPGIRMYSIHSPRVHSSPKRPIFHHSHSSIRHSKGAKFSFHSAFGIQPGLNFRSIRHSAFSRPCKAASFTYIHSQISHSFSVLAGRK